MGQLYFETENERFSIHQAYFERSLNAALEKDFKLSDIHSKDLEAFKTKYRFPKMETERDLIFAFRWVDNIELKNSKPSGMCFLLNHFIQKEEPFLHLFAKLAGFTYAVRYVDKEDSKKFFSELKELLDWIKNDLKFTDDDYYLESLDDLHRMCELEPQEIFIYPEEEYVSNPSIEFCEFMDREDSFKMLKKLQKLIEEEEEYYEWEDIGQALAEKIYTKKDLFELKYHPYKREENNMYPEEFFFNGNVSFLEYFQYY